MHHLLLCHLVTLKQLGLVIPSQDMVKPGSLNALAVTKCLEASEPVNKEARDHLTVSFPEEVPQSFCNRKVQHGGHRSYLARVNVWKQQVEVHLDKNNKGLAVSFRTLRYYSTPEELCVFLTWE